MPATPMPTHSAHADISAAAALSSLPLLVFRTGVVFLAPPRALYLPAYLSNPTVTERLRCRLPVCMLLRAASTACALVCACLRLFGRACAPCCLLAVEPGLHPERSQTRSSPCVRRVALRCVRVLSVRVSAPCRVGDRCVQHPMGHGAPCFVYLSSYRPRVWLFCRACAPAWHGLAHDHHHLLPAGGRWAPLALPPARPPSGTRCV